jgi:hypothetical protein
MELNDARLEATRLEGEAIETDASLKDKSWLLSTCQHELDKLRKSIDKSIIKE